MPRVRVFLLTYRRPQLLRRALASLRAQTFTDWTCELHNDAPDDPSPAQLVAATADARITLHSHEKNWGPVSSFNHAFAGGPEPFATILEDDNWWEPAFLSTTLHALDARPDAALAWSNMRLWQEAADGKWHDTGRTIWSAAECVARPFQWPEMIQAVDALHSNGAMIFRPEKFASRSVPSATPFAIIEQLRERAARGPLLLLPQPLANFALTLSTARGEDRDLWLQSKLLIAASFFATTRLRDEDLAALWHSRRAARPRDTGLLFFAALALRDPRLLHRARWADATRFLLGCLRHPVSAWRGLAFRRAHPAVWTWLQDHTLAGETRLTVLAKHSAPSS